MASTAIEWTDRVWNPVTGCTKVSPGCKYCYAETVAGRFWATQYRPMLADGSRKTIDVISTSHHEDYLANGLARPRRFADVMTHKDRLTEPLRWKKPQRVFVNSMSDLFHEDVPDSFIDQVFAVMAFAEDHTFQILTKRPARMLAYLTDRRRHDDIVEAMDMPWWMPPMRRFPRVPANWPMPNVWLGVSVEDQQRADERIPLLLQTPAAVRFISAEPLLGPVDLTEVAAASKVYRGHHLESLTGSSVTCLRQHDALRGIIGWVGQACSAEESPDEATARLDWVIVGGESGPGARPCDVAWVRSIVQQCQSASVPVFVKQLGAVPLVPACRQSHWDYRFIDRPEDKRFTGGPERWVMHTKNRKGGDPLEWPEDLRAREFPR